MRSKILCTTFALAGLLATVAPAWCQHYRTRSIYESEGSLRLWLGAFRPQGDSQYFRDNQFDFTNSSSSDLQGLIGGVDYLLPLDRHLSLLFSGSYYEANTAQSYRDFTDEAGRRIRHDQTLGIGSATLGVVVNLTERRAPIVPYIGAGGGAYFWRLEETGDFIDFNNHNQIFNDSLQSSGTAFGYYFLAGLEAPIGRHTSVFAEGRWSRVKDDLRGDFEGFGRLDLSGTSVSAGLSWRL